MYFVLYICRYGDYTPKSDYGKIAVAIYAIAIVNVMACILKVGRQYLEDLCLMKTAITTLPVSIGNLHHLVLLNLCFNRLIVITLPTVHPMLLILSSL